MNLRLPLTVSFLVVVLMAAASKADGKAELGLTLP